MSQNNELSQKRTVQNEKWPYAAPAIIYEAAVTTRAGSPLSGNREPDPIDPADLFND